MKKRIFLLACILVFCKNNTMPGHLTVDTGLGDDLTTFSESPRGLSTPTKRIETLRSRRLFLNQNFHRYTRMQKIEAKRTTKLIGLLIKWEKDRKRLISRQDSAENNRQYRIATLWLEKTEEKMDNVYRLLYP
ncbi:hypothetical protein HN446_01890 [bacterium]|jgi:hypothetical protein|nr:hypothetical protein [bacterium]